MREAGKALNFMPILRPRGRLPALSPALSLPGTIQPLREALLILLQRLRIPPLHSNSGRSGLFSKSPPTKLPLGVRELNAGPHGIPVSCLPHKPLQPVALSPQLCLPRHLNAQSPLLQTSCQTSRNTTLHPASLHSHLFSFLPKTLIPLPSSWSILPNFQSWR